MEIVKKVLEFIGLFLLISSEFLFLLDFVLKTKKPSSSINKYLGMIKAEENIDKLITGKRFFGTLVLVIIALALCVYTYLVFRSQGNDLSQYNLFGIILSLAFGTAIAGFIYALWLMFISWLMKKNKWTKKIVQGSALKRLMTFIGFSLVTTLILLGVFMCTYYFINLDSTSPLYNFVSISIFILGGFATISLILIFIFLIFLFVVFIASYKHRFWRALLIMWVLGGITLLINVWV